MVILRGYSPGWIKGIVKDIGYILSFPATGTAWAELSSMSLEGPRRAEKCRVMLGLGSPPELNTAIVGCMVTPGLTLSSSDERVIAAIWQFGDCVSSADATAIDETQKIVTNIAMIT